MCNFKTDFPPFCLELISLQIKNLAGELGLDRGLVIGLLRNPPPELLLMSDSLPDEAPSKPETKEIEPSPVADEVEVDEIEATETEPQRDLPVHVMSTEWSAQKRLKKAQLETLEKVYFKSKRPTVSIFFLHEDHVHSIFSTA